MDYIYNFDPDNCIYNDKCNYYKTENCKANCYHYQETDYLIKTANIPIARLTDLKLRPEKTDVEAFKELQKIGQNIVDFVTEGCNLYIYSNNTGNGKTTWAIKLLLNYINKIHYNNNFNPRCYFLSTLSFLCLTRQSLSFSADKTEFDRIKLLAQNCDLLILDDIAATKNSQYEILPLFDIINHRSINKKSIISTSNVTPDNLGQYLDERIKSRLLQGYIIELRGGDFRRA